MRIYPSGLAGIISSTMGRYREFDMTLGRVVMPPHSGMGWEIGCDIAHNLNNLCRKILENKNFEWLWILGDDHVFTTDILINLIDRNVDIVAPLCLKRSHPFKPVIYTEKEGKYYQIDCDYLKGKSGLLKTDGCGNAGMLIRRHVIERMGKDWHRMGWQFPEHGGSDLYFCKRAKEHGFKIYVDLDNPIGHITHMAVWPKKKEKEYSVAIHTALDLPYGAKI